VVDFYKMDPADWDNGTARLSLEEEAAYLRIINSIHKHKGPVPDVDRVLAGMFRTSTRKARALVLALMSAGKVVIEDGAIWNDRARSDLVHRGFVSVSRAESGAKGGRKSAEVRAKSLETLDADEAIASTREEKSREEKIDMGKPISPADKPPDKMRLPADWALSDEGWAYARSQAIPDEVIEDEARGFHAYWTDRRDRDAKKSHRGWEQCWANRCRAIAGRYQGRGMAGKASPGGHGQGSSIASIAARRWLDEAT
jgi:uncharacterized protein YdaU (DUF1376 family)